MSIVSCQPTCRLERRLTWTRRSQHRYSRAGAISTAPARRYALQAWRGLQAQFVKVVNGTTTVLATLTSTSYFTQKWAQLTLSVSGATLQAQIYRPDTAQYLGSSGQWQAEQAWALTITDSGSPITGAGLVGLSRAALYDGTIYLDDFSAVSLASDSVAPTITITAPDSGATLTGEHAVQATATDAIGVTRVEFYLDGVLQTTDENAPYNWTFATTTVANSSHVLTAKAYDAAGNMGQTSVTVTTSNDKQAPSVTITEPTAGATITGTKKVEVTATDSVEMARVEFWVDSVLRGTDAIAPYTWNFDTTTVPNGSHTLTAKAYDAAGNMAPTSVSVTVSNNTDTQPPTVRITNLVEGVMLYDTFSVTTEASDNVGVTKVEFYVDGTLQATDLTTPYTWDFDSTAVGNNAYTITAKAFDVANNHRENSVDIRVYNIPRHYDHIRIAELAYSGWTQTSFETSLLQNSVDLVVPHKDYLAAIEAVAPNTPKVIYFNYSNVYLDLLTDWLAYADQHGLNPIPFN